MRRRNQRLPVFDRQFEALPIGKSKIPSVSRCRIFRRLRCKKDWDATCNTQRVKWFTNFGRVKKKVTYAILLNRLATTLIKDRKTSLFRKDALVVKFLD